MGLFSGIGKIFKSVTGGLKDAFGMLPSAIMGGNPLKAGLRTLAGAAGTYGPLIQGGLSYLGGIQTNEANSAQALRQMEFQQYNSDTAYQRAMADMKAAGLNPMLAYQQGGASTPGGASAKMEDALNKGISSSMQAKQLEANLENLEATNDSIRENTKYTSSNVNLNRDLQSKARADTLLSINSARKAAVEAKYLENTKGIKGSILENLFNPKVPKAWLN